MRALVVLCISGSLVPWEFLPRLHVVAAGVPAFGV